MLFALQSRIWRGVCLGVSSISECLPLFYLLCITLFGDQGVGHAGGFLQAAGHADIKAIFAIDDQGRNTADLISNSEFLGFLQLALYTEGVSGVFKVCLVNTKAGNESGDFRQ